MNMTIGDRLKQAREKKGISMSELAEKAHVSKSYISSIERGLQQNPSVQFIEKVSKVLGLKPEQLVQTNTKELEESLDEEWLQIAKEAMESGISIDEFKSFLEFQKFKQKG